MRNVIVIGQVCLVFLNLFQGQYEEKDLSPESEPGEFGLGWGQVIDPWEVMCFTGVTKQIKSADVTTICISVAPLQHIFVWLKEQNDQICQFTLIILK